MLSALISSDVKRAARKHCVEHGLKLAYFIEHAIIEQLEDELDLEVYLERRHEPTVSLAAALAGRRPAQKKRATKHKRATTRKRVAR